MNELDLSHEPAHEEQRVTLRTPWWLGGGTVELQLHLAAGSPVGEASGMLITSLTGALLGFAVGSLLIPLAPAGAAVGVAAAIAHTPAILWDRDGTDRVIIHVKEDQPTEGTDVGIVSEPASSKENQMRRRETRVIRIGFPAKIGHVALESEGGPFTSYARALAAALVTVSACLAPAAILAVAAFASAGGPLPAILAGVSFVGAIVMFKRPRNRTR
jgi:hypothetical protein